LQTYFTKKKAELPKWIIGRSREKPLTRQFKEFFQDYQETPTIQPKPKSDKKYREIYSHGTQKKVLKDGENISSNYSTAIYQQTLFGKTTYQRAEPSISDITQE